MRESGIVIVEVYDLWGNVSRFGYADEATALAKIKREMDAGNHANIVHLSFVTEVIK
jgi:hypothetical protein